MKAIVMSLAVLMSANAAMAASMSCIVSVYRAQDLKEGTEQTTTQVVEVQLDQENEGEKEVVINGESVLVSFYKRQFADVYNISLLLLTPVADRMKGVNWVSSQSDYLINEGPAKDNGWTVNPRPGATKYEYLNFNVGTFTITQKMKAALVKDGKWGTYPFTSIQNPTQNSYYLAEAAQELLSKNLLQKTDVIALSTAFSCTHNK